MGLARVIHGREIWTGIEALGASIEIRYTKQSVNQGTGGSGIFGHVVYVALVTIDGTNQIVWTAWRSDGVQIVAPQIVSTSFNANIGGSSNRPWFGVGPKLSDSPRNRHGVVWFEKPGGPWEMVTCEVDIQAGGIVTSLVKHTASSHINGSTTTGSSAFGGTQIVVGPALSGTLYGVYWGGRNSGDSVNVTRCGVVDVSTPNGGTINEVKNGNGTGTGTGYDEPRDMVANTSLNKFCAIGFSNIDDQARTYLMDATGAILLNSEQVINSGQSAYVRPTATGFACCCRGRVAPINNFSNLYWWVNGNTNSIDVPIETTNDFSATSPLGGGTMQTSTSFNYCVERADIPDVVHVANLVTFTDPLLEPFTNADIDENGRIVTQTDTVGGEFYFPGDPITIRFTTDGQPGSQLPSVLSSGIDYFIADHVVGNPPGNLPRTWGVYTDFFDAISDQNRITVLPDGVGGFGWELTQSSRFWAVSVYNPTGRIELEQYIQGVHGQPQSLWGGNSMLGSIAIGSLIIHPHASGSDISGDDTKRGIFFFIYDADDKENSKRGSQHLFVISQGANGGNGGWSHTDPLQFVGNDSDPLQDKVINIPSVGNSTAGLGQNFSFLRLEQAVLIGNKPLSGNVVEDNIGSSLLQDNPNVEGIA